MPHLSVLATGWDRLRRLFGNYVGNRIVQRCNGAREQIRLVT